MTISLIPGAIISRYYPVAGLNQRSRRYIESKTSWSVKPTDNLSSSLLVFWVFYVKKMLKCLANSDEDMRAGKGEPSSEYCILLLCKRYIYIYIYTNIYILQNPAILWKIRYTLEKRTAIWEGLVYFLLTSGSIYKYVCVCACVLKNYKIN